MDLPQTRLGAFCPVLERDLRTASRRQGTWWRRVAFGLIGTCGVAVLLVAASRQGTPAAVPFSAAQAIVFPLLLYCLFRGVKLTADSLSAERRQGTLPLLFMTNLTAPAIVLTKAASAFIQGVSPILALIPPLAIVLLLGRMTGETLVRVTLTLATTLALSLSVGMAISSVAREQRKSESTAGFVLLFLWLGILFLDQWIRRHVPAWPELLSVRQLSPACLLDLAFGSTAGARSGLFWRALAIVWLEAALLLGFSIWRLNHTWRGEPARARGGSFRSPKQVINPPRAGKRTAGPNSNKDLLQVSPFCWLIARERWRRTRIWALLVLCAAGAGLVAWVVHKGGGEDFVPLFALLTLVAWYLMLKVLLAEESGRELAIQRSTGALEFLLVTPLGPRQILEGQWLALRKRFAGPAIAFFALHVVLLASTVSGSWPLPGSMETADGVLFLLAAAAMFIADVITLGWVGMWLSLKLRRKRDVAGSTVWRVMVIPNLLFLGWVIFFGTMSVGSGTSVGPRLHLAVWLAFGLLTDFLLVYWCRGKLSKQFREMATLEYVNASASGAWGRRLGTLSGRWFRRLFRPARPLRPVAHG